MSNGVKLVRLVTGEELIGRVVSETETTITLNKVLVLIVTGHDQATGQPQLAMAPWMPYIGDEKREIQKSATTFSGSLVKPMEDVYIRLTSNIVPANELPDLSKLGKKAQRLLTEA